MGYAIVTRHHGPTYSRGSRVTATGPAPHLPAWDAAPGSRVPPTRATVAWDCAGGADETYRAAAQAVVDKLTAAGWTVHLDPDDTGAMLPDDSGRVFILRYR